MNNIKSQRYFLNGVIILLLCLLAYGNIFQNDFILDDHKFLFQEDSIGNVSTLSLATKGIYGNYRPLGWILMKYELLVFNKDPAGYHIVSFLLFFCICYSFFLIISRLWGNEKIALLTSCLYAAHPINSFLVNYKTAQVLILFILFMQISTLFFLKYLDNNERKYYLLSLVFYFFSLLSHEMSLLLPAYFFLIIYFFKDVNLRKNINLCIPFIVPLIIYLIYRSQVHKNISPYGIFSIDITFNQYIATLFSLIYWYCSRLISPVNIIWTWDEQFVQNPSILVNIVLIIMAIATLGLLIKKGRGKIWAFCLVIFAFGFLPLLLASFVHTPITATALIETHWFSFSSIGIFVLVAILLLEVFKRISAKKQSLIILTAVILLSLLTRSGNVVYKNAETLCNYWIKVNPLNQEPWVQIVDLHKENNNINQLENELDLLDKRLATQSSYIAYKNRGYTYHLIGSYNKAIIDYNNSILLREDYLPVYVYRAKSYISIQQYDLALLDLSFALEVNPNYALAYYHRSTILDKLSQPQKALEDALRAKSLGIPIHPSFLSELYSNANKEKGIAPNATREGQSLFQF